MKRCSTAAKYRHFGRNLCLHLHITIRLCFNKCTESSITISIISRGRI